MNLDVRYCILKEGQTDRRIQLFHCYVQRFHHMQSLNISMKYRNKFELHVSVVHSNFTVFHCFINSHQNTCVSRVNRPYFPSISTALYYSIIWRHERSLRLIRNLSNCEREAWKKFRLQRDSNPWPLRYRCSVLPTELWSHNCWEQVNFSGSIMPLRVIQHYSDWVCTAVMSKWRHERSSRLIRNLSNCEREAWKKFRLQWYKPSHYNVVLPLVAWWTH